MEPCTTTTRSGACDVLVFKEAHMTTIRNRLVAAAAISAGAAAVAVGLFWPVDRSSTKGTALSTDSSVANVSLTKPSGISGQAWKLLEPTLRSAGNGPQPQAFSRPEQATDTPLQETDLLGSDARLIATATIGGTTRNLYIGKQAGVLTCALLQTPSDAGSGNGGCNPASNPFMGSHVIWNSGSENTVPQRLILSGVVDDSVARIEVATSDGKYAAVPLSADDGFIYVVEKSHITPVDVPQTIRAFDRAGRLIEEVKLGITFGA